MSTTNKHLGPHMNLMTHDTALAALDDCADCDLSAEILDSCMDEITQKTQNISVNYVWVAVRRAVERYYEPAW